MRLSGRQSRTCRLLTAPRFNPEGTSAEVDRRVKSIVQNALSVYRVDADQLMALRPDVIVTQSQCEVCAVSQRDLHEALGQWLGGNPPAIVSLTATSLDGVYGDIGQAASVLRVEAAGARVVAAMKARIAKHRRSRRKCRCRGPPLRLSNGSIR